jgi:hypothetical protein
LLPPAAVTRERLIASTFNEYTPSYLPDGGKIAFTPTAAIWRRSGRERGWGACGSSYVDGHRSHREPPMVAKWSRHRLQLLESPLRSVRARGRYEVHRVSFDGGAVTRLTSQGGAHPEESIDCKWLYYAKGPRSPTSIWRVPVHRGEETEVVDGLSYSTNFAVAEGDRSRALRFCELKADNPDSVRQAAFGRHPALPRSALPPMLPHRSRVDQSGACRALPVEALSLESTTLKLTVANASVIERTGVRVWPRVCFL